ncbi:hypothetical protein BXZ70DRAFT_1013371 [Cristinia sonorae]|uniref:Uncharacterized protein n=1 Tax=Cristinia sonorae TaxID=1940300 RepID=A0A8K0UD57_9AGAR|nr:hypothetical protein BXZ70DRAFT_1013371 [Cristinia sonorae]
MPFSFSKTSIIHPTHATTSAQSLGVRPDLNRLYTGRDYWEKKGHHDFSLWKVLSRKNSSSIRVEPEYNKKADGWKVSSVTGGKAGKPFGCLVPNSQVGILRLFIFRYHIARTIALNPLWKEFDENVQFAAKLEAEFYYAVMMAVKEEMRGAKKQKRNVPMHDVRLGALDEWMAFELFTKGDYFEYLQHPEIAVGAKGAVIEDLHEQLKGYITQKAKSIADENYLDSTRWTDPKQREMWYTALHDGGWSISRCKESNGWAGWTELPPLQQGTMDFGPFPSLEVEEWISSVEVPMKPDDVSGTLARIHRLLKWKAATGLGSSGNLENNGVSVEESAGEMCEEEGGAVKEGTATQRSVREGDDNLDDEGRQAGFMAQNIALSTGIANGEVPAARNEDIPPSGIPPVADSPGLPSRQMSCFLRIMERSQPPTSLRLVFRRLQTRPGLPSRQMSCFLRIMERSQRRNEDIPPSGIPPAADSPGLPSADVLLPEDHGEVPAARNDDILRLDHGEVPAARNDVRHPPSGIPPAADSPGAPQPPAVLLPEDHGEVPAARNDDIPRSGIPPTMTVGQGLLQDKTPAQQSMSSHSTDTSSATLQSGNSAQATPPKMIPLKRSSSGVDAYPYTSGKKKWVLENPPDVLKGNQINTKTKRSRIPELDLVKLWEMRQKEQETMSVPAAKRGFMRFKLSTRQHQNLSYLNLSQRSSSSVAGRNDTSLGMQGQGFAQSMSHPESKISMGSEYHDGPREESHVVEDSFAECESSFGTEKQLEEFHNKSSFREIFPRAPSATGRTDRSTYSSDIPEKDILTASPTQSDDTVSAVPPITHGKGLQFMVVSSKLRNDNMNDSGESEVSVNEEEPAKTGSKVMARGRAKKPRQGRIVAIRRKKNENEEEEEEDDSDSDQLSENWLKFVEMVNFLDLEEDFADVEGDDIVHDCSESWALPEMGVNVTDLEVPFTPEDGKDSSTTQQSKALTKSAKAARRSTRKTRKTKTFPRASRSGTDGWVESGQSEQTPPSMETLTPQSQSGLHPELITAEQVHSWDAVWRRNQEEQSEWTEESEEELEVERIMSSPPPTEPDPDTTELESGVLSIQTAYDDWFTKWKGRLETAGALDDSQGIMLSADAFRRTILDITRKLGLESPADLGSLFMGDSWTLVWKSTGSQVSKVLIWRACYLGSKDKELGKKNINDGPREESHVVEDSFAECESSFGTEKQLEEFHNKSSFREVFPRAPSATGRTDRSTYSSDIPEKDILTASPTQSDDTVSAVPPITHGKGLQFMVVSSKLRNDNMNDSGESEVSVNEEEPAKTGSKVMARGGAKRPRQGRIVAIRRKKNENEEEEEEDDSDSDQLSENWLKFVEMVNFLDLEEDFADVEGDDIVHDCSESWALPEMGVNVTDLEVPFTPEDGKDSSTTQQSKALTKSAKAARRSTRKTSKSEYSSLRAAVSNAQDKPTDDPTEQDVAVRGGDEFVEGDDIVHDCSESWALPEMGVNVTDLEVPFTPEDGKDSSTTQQSKALTKSAQAARRSTRKTSKSEYSSLRAAVSNAQDKPTDDPTEQDVATSYMTVLSLGHYQKWE